MKINEDQCDSSLSRVNAIQPSTLFLVGYNKEGSQVPQMTFKKLLLGNQSLLSQIHGWR